MKRFKISPELLEEYRNELVKVYPKDSSMISYLMKRVANIVKLSNGVLVPFEKHNIETSFCFGYDGDRDYDDANNMVSVARSQTSYFKNENLRCYDDKIDSLSNPDNEYLLMQHYPDYNVNIYSASMMTAYSYDGQRYLYDHIMPKGAIKLTDDDRKAIIDALFEVRKEFDLRLNTYIKRYGTSKLKCWSYWRD